MYKCYNEIIKILESSLKNKKYIFDENEDINWNDLLYKANSHQITSLVYNSIDKKSLDFADKDVINKWKSDVFKLNMNQIQKVNEYRNIMHDLMNRNIDIIVLKGIVNRNYYPRPEFRMLGDLDILVHEDNFADIKKYFSDNGFKRKDEGHPVHAEFVRNDGLSVEVHWKLMNNLKKMYGTMLLILISMELM